MPIGTSTGQHYEDAFSHHAGMSYTPAEKGLGTEDKNEMTPEKLWSNQDIANNPDNVYNDQGEIVDYYGFDNLKKLPSIEEFNKEADPQFAPVAYEPKVPLKALGKGLVGAVTEVVGGWALDKVFGTPEENYATDVVKHGYAKAEELYKVRTGNSPSEELSASVPLTAEQLAQIRRQPSTIMDGRVGETNFGRSETRYPLQLNQRLETLQSEIEAARNTTSSITREEALAEAQRFARGLGEDWDMIAPRIQERYIEGARQDLEMQRTEEELYRQEPFVYDEEEPYDYRAGRLERNKQLTDEFKDDFKENKDKVKTLGPMSVLKGSEVSRSGYGHSFRFMSDKGAIGDMNVRIKDGGKEIYVADIGGVGGHDVWSMGKKEVRNLFKLIANEFPDAEYITGFRVSGARAHSGKGSMDAKMRIPGRGHNRGPKLDEDEYGNNPDLLTRGQ